jgi:hypothetical protein
MIFDISPLNPVFEIKSAYFIRRKIEKNKQKINKNVKKLHEKQNVIFCQTT